MGWRGRIRRSVVPPGRPRPSRVGDPGRRLEGPDPAGHAIEWEAASPRTGLLFVTTSCRPCLDLWRAARADPAGESILFVTPGPETESRRETARLAGDAIPVLMSGTAWTGYGVTGAPWLTVVDEGLIVWDGEAPAWDEVRSLVAPPGAPT